MYLVSCHQIKSEKQDLTPSVSFTLKLIITFLVFLIATSALADEVKPAPTLKEMVASTLMMKLVFQLRNIQLACKEDIEKLCKALEPMKQPGCILENRVSVSKQCESLLGQEFGSLPSKTSFEYKGFLIPEGSSIFRRQQNNQIFQVITKKPTIYKGIKLEPNTFSFQSDMISPIPISKVTNFDGIKFTPPKVAFSHEGFLRQGRLSVDTIIDGIAYQAGSDILLFKQGKVEAGLLLKDVSIDGVTYKGDWEISFFKSGIVKMGVLAEPAVIQGQELPVNTTVAYSPDGSIKYSFPIHESMFNPDGSRKKFDLENLRELMLSN